jgi:hypothetical protein
MNEAADLSVLQKELLKTALLAHYRTPLDLAGRYPDPGCFGIKSMMQKFEDRKERACRRADTGRSIARLIKRGVLACGSERGKWRLTPLGLAVARTLYPEMKPWTKRELAKTLALREAMHSVMGRRRGKRGSGKKAMLSTKESGIDSGEIGVEVEMDY